MNDYQKIVMRKLDEVIPKTPEARKPKTDFGSEKKQIVDFVKGLEGNLLVTKETDYTVEILIEEHGNQTHVCLFDFAILGTNRVTEPFIVQEILQGLENLVTDD